MESDKRRVWTYGWGGWDPDNFLAKFVYFGGDEYCRRTIVLFGLVVIALWAMCDCNRCADTNDCCDFND